MLWLLLLLAVPAGHAQDLAFEPLEPRYIIPPSGSGTLSAPYFGAVEFVDINRDGDLDLLVSGVAFRGAYVAEGLVEEAIETSGGIAWVRWHSAPEPIPGGSKGQVSLADVNNDGIVDAALSGASNLEDSVEAMLAVASTSGNVLAELPGYYNSDQALIDYDSDGDRDLIVAGFNAHGRHETQLYRQDATGWRPVATNLPHLAYSTVAAGDVDGDSDADLFLSGVRPDGRRVADLYENQQGTFVPRGARLPALLYGSAAWGDYDADGDADLALAGGMIDPLHVYRGTAYLLQNTGGSLQQVETNLPGVMQGELLWVDGDLDGDLDLFITGSSWAEGPGTTKLYLNDSGRFSPADAPRSFGHTHASASGGDYDRDGDIDFFVAGHAGGTPSMVIYRNEATESNEPPSPPAALVAIPHTGSVTLTWNPAVDDRTPPQTLTYNLRVGTAPAGIDIVSPMADPQTGRRWVSGRGNVGLGTTHTLRNLPSGTYYWSVQSVDTNFEGSSFAPEGTFVIP